MYTGWMVYDIKIFFAIQEYFLRSKNFRHIKCDAKDISQVKANLLNGTLMGNWGIHSDSSVGTFSSYVL